MKAVAVVSGGMDSATLLYEMLLVQKWDVSVVCFDYGQRHSKELQYSHALAIEQGLPWHCVDLRSAQTLLGGSSLTDDIPVPHGHYAEESMKATVVPNRNAIMLSIAYGYAVSLKADKVGVGVHSGDHFIYPDCRLDFIEKIGAAFRSGTEALTEIYAPFLELSKTQICALGAKLGVPYDQTWTCYEGGAVHCGQCGACVERKEAFRDSGTVDPTEYKV